MHVLPRILLSLNPLINRGIPDRYGKTCTAPARSLNPLINRGIPD